MSRDVKKESQFEEKCKGYISYMMTLVPPRDDRSGIRTTPYVFDVILILSLVTATSQFSFMPSTTSVFDHVLETVRED
jgi:hypothetical protein